MISFKKKYILITALVILTIGSIITLNLDNGEHTNYVGEVLETKYYTFPRPHTEIIFGLKPAPRKSSGQPEGIRLTDGIYKSTVTYRGEQTKLFQIGEYYRVTDRKTYFTLYPKITEVRLSEIKTRTFVVTGSGGGGLIEAVTWLNPSDLKFKGNYFGSFDYGRTYKIEFFGNILLNYIKIN